MVRSSVTKRLDQNVYMIVLNKNNLKSIMHHIRIVLSVGFRKTL